MIILVCGYSASGKSFVSKYLSKKLNYKVIYTSDVLNQFIINENKISTKTKMNKGWYERSNLMEIRKNNFSFDKKLDKYLISLIKEKENLIFDSSTLPYLLKKKKGVIRIWLKATYKVRAERMSLRNKISIKDALRILKKKDDYNRNYYKKLYGFTLGKDLSIFDFVLDTTNLTINEVFKECLSFVKNKL